MAALLRGMMEHGKPDWLYFDNGKDFRANRIAGGRNSSGKAASDDCPNSLLAFLGVEVVWRAGEPDYLRMPDGREVLFNGMPYDR
jgi:hypothetical protein